MKHKITDYQKFTTIDSTVEERRKFDVGDIWSNAAKCKKCKQTIRSKNRHDFKECKCGAIAVDGGSWYARRVGELENCEDKIIMYNKLQ